MRPSRFDILCRVIDNFGDAGFAWRLARQLVAEHGLAVRLWIDDIATLARIAPMSAHADGDWRADGVEIRSLDDVPLPATRPQVLVAAFGCALPPSWAEALAAAVPPPVCINLEYLTAEEWVDGMHGLPSPHPQLPLMRWVYFPGFTPASGGLLRERGLFAARDAFQADRDAQSATWAALGLPPPGRDELAVSLFCYPNAALPALLDAWADGDRAIRVVVPDKVAVAALDRWTSGKVPHAGQRCTRGALTLAVAAFTDQDRFDRRLWACDLNVVRGEDSFVRGQWAARPMVWHAYPQDGRAHDAKIAAFLDRYLRGAAPATARALAEFTWAFNAEDPRATASAWPALLAALPALAGHAGRWAAEVAQMPDLATRLVDFARSRL